MNAQTREPQSGTEIAHFQKPRLPWNDAIEERFSDLGVTKASWKALVEAVFPAAKSVDSVVMALSYCKARRLDPFKRPVHIVPVYDSLRKQMVETVWPGISELRTTAMRTGQMAGMDAAIFGDMETATFEGEIKRGDGWEKIVRDDGVPALVPDHRLSHGGRPACSFCRPEGLLARGLRGSGQIHDPERDVAEAAPGPA